MSEKKRKNDANIASSSLKALGNKRRQIYKPVLDTPYQEVTWPLVSEEIADQILNEVISVLNANKDKGGAVKGHGVTVGFNSTTGALEKQAQRSRQRQEGKGTRRAKRLQSQTNAETSSESLTKEGSSTTGPMAKSTDPEIPAVSFVLICRNDIKPRLLTDHFPILCFTASNGLERPVKLITLPKGSKDKLAQAAVALSSGIIGLSRNCKGIEALAATMDANVGDLKIPWLEKMPHYQKPMLNVLKTSAPIVPKKNDQKAKNKESQKPQTTVKLT